jgi:hypothetical protein
MLIARTETKNKGWKCFSNAERQTQKTSFRDKSGRRGEGGITREESQRTRNRHSRYGKENRGMERRQRLFSPPAGPDVMLGVLPFPW